MNILLNNVSYICRDRILYDKHTWIVENISYNQNINQFSKYVRVSFNVGRYSLQTYTCEIWVRRHRNLKKNIIT